jgi:hypothetical protein
MTLMESVIVHVPAQPELDADQAEYGTLSLKNRAFYGQAACQAGNPDHSGLDPFTSAVDTITNVLHYMHYNVNGGPRNCIEIALMHFDAEIEEARND